MMIDCLVRASVRRVFPWSYVQHVLLIAFFDSNEELPRGWIGGGGAKVGSSCGG